MKSSIQALKLRRVAGSVQDNRKITGLQLAPDLGSHHLGRIATRRATVLSGLGIEPWIDRDGTHGGARRSLSRQQATRTL
jgi:hypothetical protein